MTEKSYIRMRRLKACASSLLFYVCRIFPIKKNQICVCTFEGKGGFGCNPKYIVEELHRRDPKLEFVWLVNNPESKIFPEYIKKASNSNLSRAYHLSRSKVWIDNYRTRYGTKKRKKQYYINTNHYTVAIKTVGLWRGEGFSKMAYLVSRADSDMIDDLVIDSDFCEEMCPKGLVYNGTYLKTGAPRCDVLFGERTKYKNKFRKKHSIPETSKVVMFAPTFREGSKNGKRSVYSEVWSIDFARLIDNLRKRFDGDWYVCIRVHPQLAPVFESYRDEKLSGLLIDENQADDMYEILAGMDAYITDYSSACFEAGYAGMPVFIYADDIDDYTQKRGALFWEMSQENRNEVCLNREIFKKTKAKLPFEIAINNDELEKQILDFDEKAYRDKLETFNRDIGLVFDGNASERIADKIENVLGF